MTVENVYDGPIVDAHHHFWDPVANHHPWLSGPGLIPFRYGDYSAIKRRYYPADYFADAGRHAVTATVYVESEWDPRDPLGETAFISRISQDHGVPNAVVAQAWLHHADAADLLARQAACPLVRSVRHKPGGAARPEDAARVRSLMSDERWRRGYAELARHDLHFDLQTSWWHAHEAVQLARDFPRTTIILNHAGLPADRSAAGLNAWRRALAPLADCPNVAVKISGLGQAGQAWTVAANAPVVNDCIAMFSPQRVMFASNFPVDGLCATFAQIFDGFKAITAGLPAEGQRAMFHDNAQRLYRTGQALHATAEAANG
ncbi:amidohydrolase [Pandoraea terrae]|uniref:Amidohydrolase n=1 Tax=Pandoraea terrae TaxID=1537710 RepID=A0A5E4RQA0_9BURK|nr:amidohydrolase family protein [Pandoraea terrae]VVD65203.1 amidohydrolase [Pandoraea terrae]